MADTLAGITSSLGLKAREDWYDDSWYKSKQKNLQKNLGGKVEILFKWQSSLQNEKQMILQFTKADSRKMQTFTTKMRTGYIIKQQYIHPFHILTESLICGRCSSAEETMKHIIYECYTTTTKIARWNKTWPNVLRFQIGLEHRLTLFWVVRSFYL